MGLGPRGFGLLLMMVGVGALAGSIAITATANRVHKGRLLIASTLVWGAGLIALAVAPNLAVAIPLLIGLGATSMGLLVVANILAQTYVEEEFRGRAMSFMMLSFSALPVGALLLGSIAEFIGLRWSLAISGIALITMMTYLGAVRGELRSLR